MIVQKIKAPIYKHNCKNCKFLDTIYLGEIIYDLYNCKNSSGKQYTARYGDHPGAYIAYAEMVAKRLRNKNPIKVAWLKDCDK